MENLRQEFLNQAVSDLENLRQKLSNESLTEELKREIFRTLHTLKGTAQTFNFNVSGKFAHELEDLLQAAQDGKIPTDKSFIALLREGLEILNASFRRAREGDSAISLISEFAQKLHDFLPSDSESSFKDFEDSIPPEIWRQLSVQEKKNLSAQLAAGNKFYEIQAGFDLSNFTEGFTRLREHLSEQGEVIAVFPQTATSAKKQIGFRIFFAGGSDTKEVVEAAKSLDADLKYFDFESDFTADLQGVAAQAVSAGKRTARRLGKEIEFKTEVEEYKVSGKYLNSISQILLHLVRNAADHAIEKTGQIKIQLLAEINNLILRITDNGQGLDVDKIRAEAIAKKLIAPDKILSRNETFDLIFTHGFSTSEIVSEISGRGVGLDVVRNTVEKLNGKIRIESDTNGTTFEVILPKEQ